jgi:hypothetical protein
MREILKQLAQTNYSLTKELERLKRLNAQISDLERMVPGHGINPPEKMTSIREFQAHVQREIERLAQELELSKRTVGQVEARQQTPPEEILQDLRFLKVSQRHNYLKMSITDWLTRLPKEIERVSRKAERIERKFTERVSLDITSPRKGDVVARNTTCRITWHCVGPAGDYLNIGLLKRGGAFGDIAREIPNDGFCDWFVSHNLPPAKDYQVSIWGLRDATGVFQESVSIKYPDSDLGVVSEDFEVR